MASIPPGGSSFLRAVYDVSQGRVPNKNGIEVLNQVQGQIIKSPMAQGAKKAYEAVNPALEKFGQVYMKVGTAYMTGFMLAFFASRPDVVQATIRNLFSKNVEKQEGKTAEEVQAEKPVVPFSAREQKLRDILQALEGNPSVVIAPNTRLVLSAGGRGFEDISEIVSNAIADLGKNHPAVKAISEDDKKAWGIEGNASEVTAEPVKGKDAELVKNETIIPRKLTPEQKDKLKLGLEGSKAFENKDYKTWNGEI